MDSILDSVKKMLGITEDYTYFDQDIIMHINSVFGILTQLGVGPPNGFSISDNTAVWSDFVRDELKLDMVKSYMYQKVKLIFDPPTTGAVMDATNRIINELEWRLNVAVDPNDNPIANSGVDDEIIEEAMKRILNGGLIDGGDSDSVKEGE